MKSRLQRTNPVEHTTEYNRMFGELTALEQHRRQLRDLALGARERREVTRRARPPVEVGRRRAAAGLGSRSPRAAGSRGTRDALYLPDARRRPGRRSRRPTGTATRRGSGSARSAPGASRGPSTRSTSPDSAASDADRLLQLVRERVTASVLLVRHVPITGDRGVRVVARRAPSGRSDGAVGLRVRRGIDPDDPFVQAAAEAALAAAKADVGLS